MIDAARDLPKSQHHRGRGGAAERVHMYGVVGVGKRQGKLFELTQMSRSPTAPPAPSNLIITGRYILQPEIFGRARRPRSAAPAARSSSPTP
jgi:UTP--glucose-1-phosphate uridylyltransferase